MGRLSDADVVWLHQATGNMFRAKREGIIAADNVQLTRAVVSLDRDECCMMPFAPSLQNTSDFLTLTLESVNGPQK